jgi:peptidyl-prolyl cis-trans isomerase B (cyclophilin B)
MLLCAAAALAAVSCKSGKDSGGEVFTLPEGAQYPQVTIEMMSGEKIVLELYPDKAPNTVLNFLDLASSGFYDGLLFHRVGEGFMIQGGCPLGNGTGDPGYKIKGEFAANDFTQNDLSHEAGVISMARSNAYDSAGCQFFICDGNVSWLDNNYAAFGKVIEGMDTVRAIASQPGTQLDSSTVRPHEDQVMRRLTVEKFGVDYPKPEVLK